MTWELVLRIGIFAVGGLCGFGLAMTSQKLVDAARRGVQQGVNRALSGKAGGR